MNAPDVERLRQIKTLPSLIKFLRDELDWPVEVEEIEDLAFDYSPEELGLDSKHAAKIKEIKQIRPLDSKQPWGIFWVNFEKKRLPMVVLRRILGSLVVKRRASARNTDRPSWHLHDLLFISSYGEEEHRNIGFAHFVEDPSVDELPVLRVLGWDDQNSIMQLDRVANRLQSHFRWPDDPGDADAWRQSWSEAFTDRYREAIRSADELIPRLAALARDVRCRVRDVLDAEIESGPMRRLFAAVQKLLIHDMDEDGFADMYAQTVAYGLLSARFSRQADLTPDNLVQLAAVSNPFLENLLENLFRLNRGKFHFDVDEVGINDVLDLLRNTNIEAIKAAFSDRSPAEDPVIRFYEGFLKQYDPKQRIKRGVFFTPRPVVSYIVRSVHELLQTEFGLEDGLASADTWADVKKRFPDLTIPKGTKPTDAFVCILDPAAGTGTFLFECIEVIERTAKDKWCRELGKKSWTDAEIVKRWRDYVPRHLLTRLYGYELMMAPYAIAHLKLALKLGETGYQFREADRLHIYLTNSLEPPTPLADQRLGDMFSTLATEAQAVNEIKRKQRFTVVIGNPPYSKMSANLNPDAVALVEPFRYVDGERVVEKGALALELNLQDDYVKFWGLLTRFLHESSEGIGAFITNSRYLASPTLRGMRFHLSRTFSAAHFTDLGGQVSERGPGKATDENVFDIEQGVSIGIGIRRSSLPPLGSVRFFRLAGSRADKYGFLAKAEVRDLGATVPVVPPLYRFSRTTDSAEEELTSWVPLDVLMPFNSGAVITSRDNLAIDFQKLPLLKKIDRFASSRSGDRTLETELGYSVKSKWDVEACKVSIRSTKDKPAQVRTILYRPFDRRYVYYSCSLLDTPSRPVCESIFAQSNLVLLTPRVKTSDSFSHALISRDPAEKKACSHDRATQMFPLYQASMGLLRDRHSNIRVELLGAAACTAPEIALQYVYAVLHSPGYRDRYGAALRDNYPGIPPVMSEDLFRALSRLGGELVALHLMESPKLDDFITTYNGPKNPEVGRVGWSDETVWLDAAAPKKGQPAKPGTMGFRGVPEAVWNFHIGGYQVCHKWLKDRKGRTLCKDDVAHYQKIVVALNQTIRLMAEIDQVIDAHGGWPDAFVTTRE